MIDQSIYNSKMKEKLEEFKKELEKDIESNNKNMVVLCKIIDKSKEA